MMKKCFLTLAAGVMVCLMLHGGAFADTFAAGVPTGQQLSRAQAERIAADFFAGLCDVSAEDILNARRPEGYFGIGSQWEGDTEDECWMLSFIMNDSPITPMALVHGTTGEIIFWQYREKETGNAYVGSLPSAEEIQREEAVRIGLDSVIQHFNGDIPADDPDLQVTTDYGAEQYLKMDSSIPDSTKLWVVRVHSANDTRQLACLTLSAEDGSVLLSQYNESDGE